MSDASRIEGSAAVDPFAFISSKKHRPALLPEFFDMDMPDGTPVLVADTHAHLDMIEDPALALARAAVAHVGFLVTIADVTEGAATTFDLLDEWRLQAQELLGASTIKAPLLNGPLPATRIVVGAHPHNAHTYLTSPELQRELRERARDPRVCGIGEVGLDYFYDHSPRDEQQQAYREHIAIAKEARLPIIIHLRDAHEDGLRILQEEGVPEAGAILHCFNRDIDVARPFMELGCHISFAGPATFNKADDVREAAAQIPLNRILTETDSPFMAPEPFRGLKCEPAFVAWTAQRIANVRAESCGETGTTFFEAAYTNALTLLDTHR